MIAQVANGWRADVDLIRSLDSKGKMKCTKVPVFRIEKKTEEEADEFAKFLRDGNIEAFARKQKYGANTYTWFVEVTDQESMKRLMDSSKEAGVPFPPGCFDRLFFQNRDDWDEVNVWDDKRNRAVPGLRINIDKVDINDQQLLKDKLDELGVEYRVRRATVSKGHVKEGNKTVRVIGAANIEKLSDLFGDCVDSKEDWRNLNNWDDKEFYVRGIIPEIGKCLNLKDRTMEDVKHIEAVLSDLGIDYGVRAATKATKRIAEGDKYLRVTHAEDVEKLVDFTSRWTRPEKASPVITKKLEGGR